MNNIFYTLGLILLSCTLISANNDVYQLDIQHWQNNTSTWENTVRYLYDYDNQGEVEAEIRQLWDATSASWVNVEKKIRKFNAQQLPTVIAKQTWTGNEWKDNFRRTYTYQINNGQVQKSTMVVNLNGRAGDERTYPNVSSFEMQRWQPLQVRYTEAWFEQVAANTEYDADGSMTNASMASCNESSEFDFDNDEDGNLTGFLKFDQGEDGERGTLIARGSFNEMAFPEQETNANVAGVLVAQDLVIYPNPATDFVRFELQETVTEEIQINLLDKGGRLIYSSAVEPLASGEYKELNIQNFPAGMYTITVQAGNFQQSGKFVKIQE